MTSLYLLWEKAGKPMSIAPSMSLVEIVQPVCRSVVLAFLRRVEESRCGGGNRSLDLIGSCGIDSFHLSAAIVLTSAWRAAKRWHPELYRDRRICPFEEWAKLDAEAHEMVLRAARLQLQGYREVGTAGSRGRSAIRVAWKAADKAEQRVSNLEKSVGFDCAASILGIMLIFAAAEDPERFGRYAEQ